MGMCRGGKAGAAVTEKRLCAPEVAEAVNGNSELPDHSRWARSGEPE
jgi:hypothetical protein